MGWGGARSDDHTTGQIVLYSPGSMPRRRPLSIPILLISLACQPGPGSGPGQALQPLAGPFLHGSAVSAYQVEVGLHASDWHAWETPDIWGGSPIDGGDRADEGPDFAHVGPDGSPGGHFRAYLAKARAMGHNAFRFSIDWSRVQPRPGPYDP